MSHISPIALFLAASFSVTSALAQTLIDDRVSTDEPVNIRMDGKVDRSIGDIMPGEVDESVRFRQGHSGDVEAVFTPGQELNNDFGFTATAIGNATDADFGGSAVVKGKQRLDGRVSARMQVQPVPQPQEITLNAAAFGNSLSLSNDGTQIVDLNQRNDGPLVEAIIDADLPHGSESTLQTSAVALSNSFSSKGPVSNFGGDLNQRSDADVTAYNRTSGARPNDRVSATAVGNSISVSRK